MHLHLAHPAGHGKILAMSEVMKGRPHNARIALMQHETAALRERTEGRHHNLPAHRQTPPLWLNRIG